MNDRIQTRNNLLGDIVHEWIKMKRAACLQTEHDGLVYLSLEEMLIALQMYKIWLIVIKLYVQSKNYNVLN